LNTIGCEEQDGEPEGLTGRSDNALIPLNIFLQQLASNNAAASDGTSAKARPPSKKPKSPKRPKSPKTPSPQGLQNTSSLNSLAGRHLVRS